MDILKTVKGLLISLKDNMEYQKDTKFNKQTSYGQPAGMNNKALSTGSVYELVNKKTEKLVTALYMVTDCMQEGDALRSKIRILGVELLSLTYQVSNLSPLDKSSHISRSQTHINEILSFIDISCTIGFISDMNGSILKRELVLLREELKDKNNEESRFNFSLEDKMFEVRQSPKTHHSSSQAIKDITIKRTYPVSFRNSPAVPSFNRGAYSAIPSPIDKQVNKQERSNKIINLIKDKKEVSIKDISIAFGDVSEKTIQRELNALVSKGQITKTGAKRWSRYSIITD